MHRQHIVSSIRTPACTLVGHRMSCGSPKPCACPFHAAITDCINSSWSETPGTTNLLRS
jgi:hypothetical protein